MKKIVTFFLFLTLVSCNDGNFDIPAFEFTETVDSCGEYVLYITSDSKTEILVITLSPSEIGTNEGDKSYKLNSKTTIIYRLFDTSVGINYFCEDIPPTTPNVLKDLKADNGTINITTTAVLENQIVTGYTYDITISNLTFNDNNERIYFENFNFGVFSKSTN